MFHCFWNFIFDMRSSKSGNVLLIVGNCFLDSCFLKTLFFLFFSFTKIYWQWLFDVKIGIALISNNSPTLFLYIFIAISHFLLTLWTLITLFWTLSLYYCFLKTSFLFFITSYVCPLFHVFFSDLFFSILVF